MEDTRKKEGLDGDEKQPLNSAQEQTVQGVIFQPSTDIFENGDALILVMEIPGVDRENVDIQLDRYRLTVTARVSLDTYANLQPLHSEFKVGHFSRSFEISKLVDQENIVARVENGILHLTLKKVKDAAPRQIEVT